MRVAIATFGTEVSPRFCFAREVMIVDIEAGKEIGRTTVALGDASYPERLRLLESRCVKLLLCGGFNRAFLSVAERAGLRVIWGVTGSIDAALRDLVAGTLASASRPGCERAQAWQRGCDIDPSCRAYRHRRRGDHR